MKIAVSATQIEKFKKYAEYIVEYNDHTNITAIQEASEIIIKHFLDSAVLINFLNLNEKIKLLDVGSGAGFPGVPLKILKPELDLTLLDSSQKKTIFLQNLVKNLNIKASITCTRAEKEAFNKNFRENFDTVVSRAVAALRILAEYSLPYVKIGGFFAAYKGLNFKNELKEAVKTIEILGGKLINTFEFVLAKNFGKRCLILIKKIKKTDKNFPRANSKILKNPF